MLDEDGVIESARMLWAQREDERWRLDRLHDFARGLIGKPEVPDGNGDEIHELAKLSVKNVCGPVVDAFASNLSVVGFRSPTAQDDDAVWELWQQQSMDARQAEVSRGTLTYGAHYVTSLPEDGRVTFRPRSPRRLTAVYADPQMDRWPIMALETWIDKSSARWLRRGILLDDTMAYPVVLGKMLRRRGNTGDVPSRERVRMSATFAADPDRKPFAHHGFDDGKPVCPVVRFVAERDEEDLPVGEVKPIITDQLAINSVNFDRLVVARYGAHPQKVIVGWTASQATLLKASASRVWTIDEDPTDVSVQQLSGAQIEPYNSLLKEMVGHVAMDRQIPLGYLTGTVENLAADTVALIYGPHTRKTARQQESMGESWEQLLRLGATMADLPQPDETAEVVWANMEARSFAGVVDGISKLTVAGADLSDLIDIIPGLTQQKVRAIQDGIRRQSAQSVMAAALAASQRPAVTGGVAS